ncbi:unnamed protein product, partial [Mesorhabditis belari]|uniref:Fibronectin type-III domain-containing protein n=1 Tax=Mesorhabditis belari TaxID=2138241 RepID=A0AAF3EGS0_9BILA
MLIFLLLFVAGVQINASPIEQIEGLRSSYEPTDGSIRLEWKSRSHRADFPYLIRYRVVGVGEWTYQRSRGNSQKLQIPNLRNNEQVEVQVRTDERTNDHWSQSLLITFQKKLTLDGPLADDTLIPPLDFKATIKDSRSVKLQWHPADQNPEIFYLVHVKQVTSKKGVSLHRQQIKTAATSFELGGLEAGARYELAVRSALPERISQTASVVEIKLPYDDEFFEIGNLMIASKFMSDGRGTVNLTWTVPHQMKHRITAYDVKYTEKNANRWRKVNFGGERPKATLHDLTGDTEYQLEIKTTLDNGHNSETTHFTFRTPRVETNPIEKVDVLFSHDVNTVQVQWILKEDMDLSQVIGYDVYLSDNKDAPAHTWQRMHVDNPEGSLAIPGLRSLSTYFVRIDVRTRDGKTVRSPPIYKFTTIDWRHIIHHPFPRTDPFMHRKL